MEKIIVFSEHLSLSAQLINLAKSLEAQVCAVTINEPDAESLSRYDIEKVIVLKGDSLRPEDYSLPLSDLVKEEEGTVLLVGSTYSGQELAAKTAMYLNTSLISNASKLTTEDGKFQTTRMMYGGAVQKTEEFSQRIVLTIESGKFDQAEETSAHSSVKIVDVDTDSKVTTLNRAAIETSGTNLAESDVVVGVGIGIETQDDYEKVNELADVLNAAIGFSRPAAEERDWSSEAQYIGISGVTISPSLYIAIGISGLVQHTVGIRDSKLIVAINNNEKAPIFKNADYGIVGDLKDIVPELLSVISENK